ncbi:hypothetical protein [Mesorhizobium sophorae]|uniref:hypothetical protein n=1 Tax=Mesorhizobium sophorae TaxID=1300294 RepID=UPI000BA37587|nr:hypothetical protein [Mesorhizobium sophorae]
MDVALYIAHAACVGRKTTYGELSAKFGDLPNGWQSILTVIAGRLRKHSCPLLPVLVVAVDTGLPSEKTYHQFGLEGVAATRKEQQKCYDFDWSEFFFGRISKASGYAPWVSGWRRVSG